MPSDELITAHRECTAYLALPGMEVGMYITQNSMGIIGADPDASKEKAAFVHLMDVGPFVRQEGRHPPLKRNRARRLEEINRIREEFGFTRQIAAMSGQETLVTTAEGSLWTSWITRHFSTPWTMVRADQGK